MRSSKRRLNQSSSSSSRQQRPNSTGSSSRQPRSSCQQPRSSLPRATRLHSHRGSSSHRVQDRPSGLLRLPPTLLPLPHALWQPPLWHSQPRLPPHQHPQQQRRHVRLSRLGPPRRRQRLQ
jgi:hypothetical protein